MSIAARQTAISCPGHTRPVVDLSFSEITLEHGYFMISACKDGQPMLRQGETGDWIGTFSGHKGAVWGAALNREAKLAATAAADFSAKVWDAVSGEALHDFSHKHIVKSVDFSSDSCKLLTASNEKLLRIFDLNAPEADPVVFSGHEDNIKHARFLPDGRSIVSCSDDKTLRIWDIASNSEVRKIPLSSSSSSLDLVSDGSTLVVTHGKNISFYSADRFEEIKKYSTETAMYSASLSPDKKTFVSGGEDFKIYRFSYEDGKEEASYKGHFGPVHCVRFSPDGEMYASGSEDGTLRLWQTNIGKTYGLWKWIDDSEAEGVPVCNVANEAMSPPTVVKAES
ncbi:serine-threonine kinase receptor-associated protein [Strongylocentrotus purpuratus]|uniref:Serine-threonine kinase receptor-associated protein n=1 Tax=Strongylocentrotus purpuratus TaxID=7668 RepID=A0A7M7P163_STRPU|nr:serine-threonine kinase receptor-associated protein [Strongylocentrotus purpuratus]